MTVRQQWQHRTSEIEGTFKVDNRPAPPCDAIGVFLEAFFLATFFSMQTLKGPLLNGLPVNGTGQPFGRPSTVLAIPPAEGRHSFSSTMPFRSNQKPISAINIGNNQTHLPLPAPLSLRNSRATPVTVNINAVKPKHMRLNDFNVLRHANTVICGPEGPILDPRMQPNGVPGELPHKRWPYAARSKRPFNQQTTNSHQPFEPPLNPVTLKSQQAPKAFLLLSGRQLIKENSQLVPANSFRQEQQRYTNNEYASAQRQDCLADKTLAKIPKLNLADFNKTKNYVFVMVADMETQTEEEYFSTPSTSCNDLSDSHMAPNGHTLMPNEKDLQTNDQTEPIVKEKLPEKESSTEHIKSSDNLKLPEELPVPARVPRIKISNLQNKNQLVACLVEDNRVDSLSQTITAKNEAQENCDNITDSDSASSSNVETSSSNNSALLSETATAVEPSIEAGKTSSEEENNNHHSPCQSPTSPTHSPFSQNSSLSWSSYSQTSPNYSPNPPGLSPNFPNFAPNHPGLFPNSPNYSPSSPDYSFSETFPRFASYSPPSSVKPLASAQSQADSSVDAPIGAPADVPAVSLADVNEQNDVTETNNVEVINSAQVEDTAANVPVDEPVKRRPGRPRKYPDDASKPVVFPKRGRGRPRKYPVEVVKEKKARGRPRKNPQT